MLKLSVIGLIKTKWMNVMNVSGTFLNEMNEITVKSTGESFKR